MPPPISELRQAAASAPPPVSVASPSSSSSSSLASPSPSPSPISPVSTIANAGAHNKYIWTKNSYFSGAGVGADAGTRVRMALVGLFLMSIGAGLTNFVVLPLQMAAFGWVVLRVILSRGGPGRDGSPRAPLGRWNPWVLRAIEWMTGLWEGLVGALLERIMGMRVHMAGDVVPDELRGEGALILSNHPSTADWLYLFSWVLREGDMTRFKIVLKGSLARVPIVGWVLQGCRYLFLARDWEKDQSHMDQVVRHWAGLSSDRQEGVVEPNPVQLLMFPEGTDLRPESYDQSTAFVAKALANGVRMQPLQHVLQPRVTGFVHMIKLLRQTGSVKMVYDLTLGSTPLPVPIESLACGNVPRDFHVHLRRYALSSLPLGDAELASWIQARWVEKDRLLEAFYANTPHAFLVSPEQQASEVTCARRILLEHFSLFAGFGLVFLVHSYITWQWPLFVMLWHAVACAIWIVINSKYKGIDTLMYKVDRAYEQEQEQIANANKKKDK